MPLNDEDRANLSAYLDGELDEEATQELEAKLNLDPEARAEADALRQAWGMLDYLPKPAPSSDFTHRTLERLSLEEVSIAKSASGSRVVRPVPRRGFPWLKAFGWAAAVLVAAGLGVAVGSLVGTAPTPDEEDPLVKNRRVLENLHLYENVDDFDFLRQLAQPELFGDEAGS